MKRRTLSASLVILHLWGSAWIYADSNIALPESELEPTCSPVVPVPSSPLTHIRQKMLGDKDFEFAILETSLNDDDAFWAYVVRKEDAGYRCYIKRIRADEVSKDSRFDPSLVANCQVDVRSLAIDSDSAIVLTDTLRQQISKAKYLTKRPAGFGLDGTSYQVFAKGAQDDLYEMYAGDITDGVKRSSRSCSVITFVLRHLLFSDKEDARAGPLNKLTKYLKSVTDGTPDGVDPFLDKEEPDPDVQFPPP